jgi:ferric-dicitrate binding protein FerR (iron transport regulator)
VTERIDVSGPGTLPEAEREDTIARLLRAAGMRADVPPDQENRVRRAVLDECRAVARARVVRRRMAVGVAAVLSAAAVVVVAVGLGSPREMTPTVDTRVAAVERLEGTGGSLSSRSGSTPTPIGLADAVRIGDRIEADATSRVGLRLSQGVSVRLDHGSRARLLSATAIELGAGALYVDSGPESPELEVHTSFGVVRDIGTQFEMRLDAASLRVRVRSGVVEVHRGAESHSARPGTELMMRGGSVVSRTVEPYGPEWAWAASVGPPFEIEGRPLAAFLEHLCREQGWTLAYADPTLARGASGIILHGSTEGLSPSDALAVVLATADLTHRLTNGELVVTRIAPR